MNSFKVCGGILASSSLIYSICNMVIIGLLVVVDQAWMNITVADYSEALQKFLSQYFYVSYKDNSNYISPPTFYKCVGKTLENQEKDEYHDIIRPKFTIFYLGFFFFFNLVWALTSLFALIMSCANKSQYFIKGLVAISFVTLLLHLIVTLIYLSGLSYPFTLMGCFDSDADLIYDIIFSELIFPLIYSGGFLGWFLLASGWIIVFCICLCDPPVEKDAKYERESEIIYAHGRPDDQTDGICMNPIGTVNQSFNPEEDRCYSRRTSNDIYSRRSSRAPVKRNVQIDYEQQPPSPILSEKNRVLPPTVPVNVSTQTPNDVGTQTMRSDIKRHSYEEEAQFVFTRTPNKPAIVAPPERRNVGTSNSKSSQYPPCPPPLPLPNMSESSPDQPWKLILRNVEDN